MDLENCLIEKSKEEPTETTLSLVTTYNSLQNVLRKILDKHWNILLRDPFFQQTITEKTEHNIQKTTYAQECTGT